MISEEDTQDLLRAAMYFNEVFKKTLLASIPAEVTTKTQMDILVTLSANDAMNMAGLSSRISIAPEQTSRAIKELCNKGLVERTRNPENRREVIAQLTPEGKQLMHDHVQELHERLNQYLGDLDKADVDELVRASRASVRAFEKADLPNDFPKSGMLTPSELVK